jgi:glycosyltransferase involved in cell wall biosynthesis
MKNITFIETIGGHGGNEFYDIGICEALAEVGIRPNFYTCDKTTIQDNYPSRVNVIHAFRGIYSDRSPLIRGFLFGWGALCTAIHSIFTLSRVAHLHVYHFSRLELLNILIHKLLLKRIIITIHDVYPFHTDNQKQVQTNKKLIFKLANRIVYHTDYAYDLMKQMDPYFRTGKYIKIPSLDIDFVYKNQVGHDQARSNLNLNEKYILFFGQLKTVKGIDILLSAFAKIKDAVDEKLLIVGRPWKIDIAYYKKLSLELGISDRVIWFDSYVSNELVPQFFSVSTLIVLPYREIYNSSVLLRSLDYRCPVIASDLPVFMEIIKEWQCAIHFKSEDIDDLAKKMLCLLNDSQLRNQLVENGQKMIQTIHTLKHVGTLLKAVYFNKSKAQ